MRCDLIFLRAPSFNQQMFFSGKNSPLSRSDFRIRGIPFHTRRPTHNETCRVHEMLASVECYGMLTSVLFFINAFFNQSTNIIYLQNVFSCWHADVKYRQSLLRKLVFCLTKSNQYVGSLLESETIALLTLAVFFKFKIYDHQLL